jgi:hypothetical protein
VAGDLGDGGGSPAGRREGQQTVLGVQDDPRCRVEGYDVASVAVLVDVRLIVGGVPRHVASDQRERLRPGDVVGGDRSATGRGQKVRVGEGGQGGSVGAAGHDEGSPRQPTNLAAEADEFGGRDDRAHPGGRPAGWSGQGSRQDCHEVEVAGERLGGAVAEGEQTVAEHDETGFVTPPCGPGGGAGRHQVGTRHGIVDDHAAVAEDRPDPRRTVGGIAESQQGVGVGVQNGRVGDEHVQERFNRGVGGGLVDERAAQLVRQPVGGYDDGRQEPVEVIEAEGSETGRGDGGHVVAAPLDDEDGDRLPGHVGDFGLDRTVAPATQDEGGIGAQAPGRTDQLGHGLVVNHLCLIFALNCSSCKTT